MKRPDSTRTLSRLPSDAGQTMIYVVLALGIFLLGAVGFGVDFANFWFHRQAAQGAADAACTAGVMDMLVSANTGTPRGGFTPGTPFDCLSATSAAPCQYAALNGYDGGNTYPGNQVLGNFVPTSSVPGIDPAAIPGLSPNSLRVDVIDHVQTFFSGMLSGNHTQDVHVRATCAVLEAKAPIPLIVLRPDCAQTFEIPGNGDVAIIGGPSTSIQTNSNNIGSDSITGSGVVDLSHGGPTFSGSNFASSGTPFDQIGTTAFLPGTTGGWNYPVTPIADPFANVPPPPPPAPALPPTQVAYGTAGCPDSSGASIPGSVSQLLKNAGIGSTSGCIQYHPGLYALPIVVKGYTAIFDPGLYYFNIPAASFDSDNCGVSGGCIAKPTGQCNYALAVNSNGVVRPSTATTGPGVDASTGVTFYLSGPGGTGGYGSVFLGSNAGSTGGRTVDNFDTTGTGTGGVRCPGGPLPDPNLSLPSSVPGDVLLGPCTYDGSYYSSPTNVPQQPGQTQSVRGLLFFQDRANGDNHGQPSMQGGGGLVIAGTMYFHDCGSSAAGADCSGHYNAFLQFQGTSGSGTFLLGNITTDELITGGGGKVSMQLDSARVYTILKATLIE
ncbi:MAG: hypothetical protein LAP13_04990 [Acidobacteriia bacterium]|nr:hypothetical protein [Terriglobia bacterium]